MDREIQAGLAGASNGAEVGVSALIAVFVGGDGEERGPVAGPGRPGEVPGA